MNRGTFIRWVMLLTWEVVVCVFWARSYRLMDEWSMATERGEVRALVVYQAGLHFVRGGRTAATRPISYDRHDIPAGADWDDLYGHGQETWRHFGFAAVRPGTAAAAATGTRSYRIAPWIFGLGREAWVVPFWPLLALPVIPMIWRARNASVRRRRMKRGVCPRCRYDLRATPGRCPECGWGASG